MEYLRKLREEHELTQQNVADYLGITKQAYCNYEKGYRTPRLPKLEKLSELYHISLEELVTGSSVTPPGYRRIPVLGSVPAGIAIEAIEDIIDWEEIPEKMFAGGAEYFGLRVEGDSMYPKYLNGDTIIIKRQPSCNSYDDCVVYVNGYNATLKTVVFNENGTLTLKPQNSNYPPRTFEKEELINGYVNIVGVVVELRRRIK